MLQKLCWTTESIHQQCTEALMVEPTETEPREVLDHAIEVFRSIYRTAMEQPESLHEMPLHTPVRRLDEVGAARNPKLRFSFE